MEERNWFTPEEEKEPADDTPLVGQISMDELLAELRLS